MEVGKQRAEEGKDLLGDSAAPPPPTTTHTAVAVVQAFRPHLTDTHPSLVPWPQAGRDRALR